MCTYVYIYPSNPSTHSHTLTYTFVSHNPQYFDPATGVLDMSDTADYSADDNADGSANGGVGGGGGAGNGDVPIDMDPYSTWDGTKKFTTTKAVDEYFVSDL